MSWDGAVPERLKELQCWFGELISAPMLPGSKIREKTAHGAAIVDAAERYILPSPKLQAWQRLQLYNQQYWWRLLDAYQENFPLLTRLFGPDDFNGALAIPCLTQAPPDHWSLGQLGAQLVDYIDHNYHAEDRNLVLDAARLDLAYLRAFVAPSRPPLHLEQLNEQEAGDLVNMQLYLQDHLFLFKLHGNLFQFRDTLIRESSDYWLSHDFPQMQPGNYYALFQGPERQLRWRALMAAEHFLLERLAHGSSLAQACDELEVTDDTLCNEALENLHLWCQEWILRGWLTREPAKPHSLLA